MVNEVLDSHQAIAFPYLMYRIIIEIDLESESSSE